MGTGTVEFLQFRGLSYLLGGFHSRHYDQVATAVSADVGRPGSDFGANPRGGLSSRPGRPVFLSLFHSHPARRLLVHEHCKPRLRHDRPAHQSQSHGGFERRFFPGLPRHRGFASPRIEFGNLDRAAHRFSSRRLGFLDLLLSFLSALESLPRPPFFWRDVNLRSPGGVFLVAGYSESLFLMGLIGFIYWSGEKGRAAKIWAALHGMLMSATRIVGIVCAAYPIVTKVFGQSWNGLRDWRGWWQRYRSAVALTIAAASGAILFFAYCQLRWGHWDMYMLTQTAGWGITPDYLAAFRPSSYHWLLPALSNPTEMSQMAMTVGALLFIAIAICEFLPVVRRQSTFAARAGIYFCAVAIYYISVSGVASVEMESMLRYEFCVHVLIVLALLQLFATIRVPSALVRAFGMGTMALVSAIGFSVQGWYVWNFTRGNWVA